MDRRAKCCVANCRTERTPYNVSEISFHSFPKNPLVRQKWVDVLKLHNTYVETPKAHDFVCRKHFAVDQNSGNDFFLKKTAIPRVFEENRWQSAPIIQQVLLQSPPSILLASVRQLDFTPAQLSYVQDLLTQISALESTLRMVQHSQRLLQQENVELREQNCKLEESMQDKQSRLDPASKHLLDNLRAKIAKFTQRCHSLEGKKGRLQMMEECIRKEQEADLMLRLPEVLTDASSADLKVEETFDCNLDNELGIKSEGGKDGLTYGRKMDIELLQVNMEDDSFGERHLHTQFIENIENQRAVDVSYTEDVNYPLMSDTQVKNEAEDVKEYQITDELILKSEMEEDARTYEREEKGIYCNRQPSLKIEERPSSNEQYNDDMVVNRTYNTLQMEHEEKDQYCNGQPSLKIEERPSSTEQYNDDKIVNRKYKTLQMEHEEKDQYCNGQPSVKIEERSSSKEQFSDDAIVNRMYNTLQTLRTHTNSKPTQEKAFKCQYCDYQTTFSSYLKRHTNVRHTKKDIFKCDYCNYSTTNKASLKKHINNRHTKEKVFYCTHCEYNNTNLQTLKRHIKKKHNE